MVFTELFTTGYYTLNAYFRGNSGSVSELEQAQWQRYQAFSKLLSNLSYTAPQLASRKQYWSTQSFFILRLLEHNPQFLKSALATDNPLELNTKENLILILSMLIKGLDNEAVLNELLTLIEQDKPYLSEPITKVMNSDPEIDECFIQKADAIHFIKSVVENGELAVCDNAANSHRDGAAKYNNGSLEEILSRHTDQAIKMVCQFRAVHQENQQKGQGAFKTDTKNTIDIKDYQKRYLKMVLTICLHFIEKGENYLSTPKFYQDLFESFPNQATKLPIYFDMQNNVYEVPVGELSHESQWFSTLKQISGSDDLLAALANKDKIYPIEMVSFAAPDRRILETSPLDRRCTSNTLLRAPTQDGMLAFMMSSGIDAQCKRAIEIAQQNKQKGVKQPIRVVFFMPGCGAFKNPEAITAAHFISTINALKPELEALNIKVSVVDFSENIVRTMARANRIYGDSLGKLNLAINKLDDIKLQHKAVVLREHIIQACEIDQDTSELHKIMDATTALINSKNIDNTQVMKQYLELAQQYKVHHRRALQIIGGLMMSFASAILGTSVAFAAALSGAGLAIALGAGVATSLAGIGLFAKAQEKSLYDAAIAFTDEVNTTEQPSL